MDTLKQRLGLSIFQTLKHVRVDKADMIVESFSEHQTCFVPSTIFIEMGGSLTVMFVLLQERFKILLSILDGERDVQNERAGHFWNPTIHKGSEVEEQWKRDTGIARTYSRTGYCCMI